MARLPFDHDQGATKSAVAAFARIERAALPHQTTRALQQRPRPTTGARVVQFLRIARRRDQD